MRTYSFRVVVEPDGEGWHASCPALAALGGATWGRSREEALGHLNEVVRMVVESLREHGQPIPDHPPEDVAVSDVSPESPRLAITA